MPKRLTATFSAIAVALLLAGCSVSANLTVPADTVADKAAKALQEQVGSAETPELDCGDDDIDLVEGEVVDCVLTDPSSGNEYDTTVTLSEIDGSNFHIDAQVASTPN